MNHLQRISGQVIDIRIEEVLYTLYQQAFATEHLNEIYSDVVQEYINPDADTFVVSGMSAHMEDGYGLLYLSALSLDYHVIHEGGVHWPIGGFPEMDEATVAVSVYYNEGEASTEYSPGVTLSHASVSSIMQLARELALGVHNEPEFKFKH